MKKIALLVILTLFMWPSMRAAESFVAFAPSSGFKQIQLENTSILVSAQDEKAVLHAAQSLVGDFERVTGKKISLVNQPVNGRSSIVVGTLGSSVIRKYVKQGVIDAKSLKGKWEKYVIATASDGNLVIAGSDRRGCVYGIYELSRQIGVSPWYWWADIPVAHHEQIFIKPGKYTDGEPKVKYRGIFINDENPCLQTWARKKFGGMNAKMYAHVYELLLRMKANLLWPGMWGSFKEYKPLVPILKNEDGEYEGNCFNEDDPDNPRLADEMGIVVGTSHHEPMQRSQQEWIRHKANYGNGEWNYMTNEQALKRFFREGIEHTKNYESLITIGMRGDEDRPMADAGGREANMKMLKKIFDDQRQIISQVTKKPAGKTPQVWTLYSEMLDYYNDGFDVPDDVTVMLCDDNWGDLRKVPTLADRHHRGGFGMYYHFSYYGAPRAMKWLQQMQIQHVWQQLSLAYDSGIDRIWMANVGDIKPAEFMTQFFMDLAWNPKKFNPENLMDYTREFCSQFAPDHADEAAEILDTYDKYAARISAEMLDDQTYSLATGEWKQVRDEFLALEAKALRLKEHIAPDAQAAYNQIILYPVQAMANLYDLYYAVANNKKLYAEGDMEANEWADYAEKCYQRDSLLTYYYNKVMMDGKWNHIMDEVHIGYTTWHAPQFNKMPEVKRLSSAQERKGGYVYEETGGTVVMDARKYFSATADEKMQWTVIPHLGKTTSALALMPSTAVPQTSSLSYRMKMSSRLDSVKVRLVFSTIMPYITGGHSVEVGFEGCSAQTFNLNRDMNWQHCYDLMYPAGAARVIEVTATLPLRAVEGDVYQLNVRPLSPGVVLQRIIVDAGGYVPSMLHGVESNGLHPSPF